MRRDVHVVLDDDDRVAPIDQIVQYLHQRLDVVGVKPGSRLVEDQKRARRGAQQRFGKLEPLRLAAGQGVQGLPQPKVPKAHVEKRLERAREDGVVDEMLSRLVCRELEDVGDVEAQVLHIEDRPDEAPPLTLRTTEDDVGQELHFDRFRAIAPARLAAPTRHVEREEPRLVATLLGEGLLGEALSERLPNLQVCRCIAA